MSQQTTGTSWLAVMAASIAGFGLLLAPAEQTDRLRTIVRDGALPGLRLVDAGYQQAVAIPSRLDWRPTLADVSPELEQERDVWEQRYRQQQAVNTQLAADLERARISQGSPFLAEPGTPLFVPELIDASIVGAEEIRHTTQRASFRQIVDVGTHDDILPADFVVSETADHETSPQHLIDQGTDSGLQMDQPVFAGRCVVGKVGQVGRWTSTIIPITDPGFFGRAQLVRSTSQGPVLGAEGVITGNGEGQCLINYIPGTEPVAVGDDVYTTVGHSTLPVPMYYGKVTQAKLTDQAQDWEITVEPAETLVGRRSIQVLRSVLNTARTSSSTDSPLPNTQEQQP